MAKAKKKSNLADIAKKDYTTYTAVINMVNNGQTSTEINGYLNNRGFDSYAASTYTNIRAKIQESEDTGVPLLELLDKRSTKSIRKLDQQGKVTGYTGKEETPVTQDDMAILKSDNMWSAESVEDEVITMLNKRVALGIADPDDLKTLANFIKIKEQYHGESNNGLSLEAVKSYAISINSTLQSIINIALAYVPEDKQQDAFEAIKANTTELMQNLEVSPSGKTLVQAIKSGKLDI